MDTSGVFPKVREIVADVLQVDESEIRPDGSLLDDYRAESIDLLDLVFRLEREFKVKIPRGQIERDARGGMPSEEFEHHGKITEQGLEKLQGYLSEVPPERFKTGMKVTQIPRLFTVETFCKSVVRGQASKAETTSS